MSQGVNPDSLDELDRRVYDLAVQPIPLAEIAVRLGVPVPQADERLQRLYRRLGVEDRAALRALTAQPEPSPSPEPPPEPAPINEYVIGGDDYVIGAELTEPRPTPRLSRRTLLAGAGVAGFLGLAGAGAALSRREARPREATATTASPSPANDTDVPLSITKHGGTSFATRRWHPGEPIDQQTGLFHMQTSDGSVQGFWFTGADRDEQSAFADYSTGGNGRFVWARNGIAPTEHLLDLLNPEVTWSWPTDRLRIVAAGGVLPESWVLMQELVGVDRLARMHVLRAAPGVAELRPDRSIEMPGRVILGPTAARPNGQKLILWAGESEAPLPYLVNLATGEVHQLLKQPGLVLDGGRQREGFTWQPLSFETFVDWVRISWSVRANGDLFAMSASFDWNGNVVHEPHPGGYELTYSPDRLHYARDVSSRLSPTPDQDPARLFRTSVEVGTHGEAPAYRIKSAALVYGDRLSPSRWLADSSGLVALTRGAPDATGAPAYQASIYSFDGSEVTRLPSPEIAANPQRWYEHSWQLGPQPSPYDPRLVAFGRHVLYDIASDKWLVANIQGDSGPAHIDPWSAGPGMFVISLPHLGHGGASAPFLLPPKVEKPPFSEEMRFVVVDTGDGLNLRAGPLVGTRVISTLRDGTEVLLAEDLKWGEGQRSLQWTNGNPWVYVQTQDGRSGWVSGQYLAWA